MLDLLNRASQILIGVGKVGDLFGGRGLTRSVATSAWSQSMDEVSGMFNKVPRGLIFAGLDVIGSDAVNSAAAIEEFDERLPAFLDQLRPGDYLSSPATMDGIQASLMRFRPASGYLSSSPAQNWPRA